MTRPLLLHRRALLGSLLGTLGCGASLANFPFDGRPIETALEPPTDDVLEVVFFSVACFMVSWRGIRILTDPFFTVYPLESVIFERILPDANASAIATPYLPDVRGVLVGHSHYDHCLDLVPIASRLHPDARIFGSQTLAHLFAGEPLARPIDVANPHLATADSPGRWMMHPSRHLRVLPIRSQHPDNIPGIHVWKRTLSRDQDKPLSRASQYQEGATLAFLVDWLDDTGRVTARIYIENSTTGPPAGLAPPVQLHEHPIDLAILGMDTANLLAQGRPSILDHIDPTHVMYCHWSDFFRDPSMTPREIVKVDLPAIRKTLMRRTDGAQHLIPGFRTRHLLRIGDGNL